MENLTVEIDIKQRVKVNVDVSEILWEVNELPIGRKWGVVSNILNGIKLNEELTDSQKDVIKKWLTNQCERFGLKKI